MNPLPIQLRYSHEPQRAECARFVEGDDSSAWLEAMAARGVSLVDTQLLMVPRSASDLSPLGVLVVSGKEVEGRRSNVEEESGVSVKSRPSTIDIRPSTVRSQSYGVVGNKLYVPVEATFSPPVADGEWTDLLSDEMAAYVWHPVVGLVGFEADDVRRVSDLIEPPSLTDDDWSRAEPGVTVNTRLWSVSGPELPSADEVLGTGNGTIGTQADKLGQLLSGPIEKVGQGMRAAVGAAMLPFAMAASKLASMMPKGGGGQSASGSKSGTGASGGIGDGWAARMLKKTADLLSARNRQIDKLLDMLHSNPDEGLKFAIPFGGQFGSAFRGLAIPGFALLSRLVDFSLGGMGGGGPADIWDIDYDRQQRLINRYRELAEREIRLGRYRRAAYIYATLLNDLPSAAAVLEKGKQYREAAVVYKEKLNRPWDAVRCLENGGMFDEAVKLYEELEEFEKIGDLYVRLEQPDEAEQAYQRAVERFIAKDDYLAAARLQEQKLEDVDAALASLDAGWPRSGQARQCFDESFRMLGRLGRHESARQRVTSLSRQTLRDDRMPMLVDGLVEAAVGYPDNNVQTFAADVARVTTSRVLKRFPYRSKPVLDALRRLAPEDRLLDRDCHRYERSHSPRRLPGPVAHKSHRENVRSFVPEKVSHFPMLPDVDWSVCQFTQQGYYAAGRRNQQVICIRGSWQSPSEPPQVVEWEVQAAESAPLLLSVSPNGDVHLSIVGGPRLETKSFSSGAGFEKPVSVGSYRWLYNSVSGVVHTASGHVWAAVLPTLELQGYDIAGTPTASRSLSVDDLLIEEVDTLDTSRTPMHATKKGVIIGLGRLLVGLGVDRLKVISRLDSEVDSIVGAKQFSLRRVVAVCEQHLMMIWRGLDHGPIERLDFDDYAPVVTFLSDGQMVIVGNTGISSYSTENEELRLLARSKYRVTDALGAFQLPWTRHVAVCRKSGVIDVLALPDLRGV